MPRVTAGGGVPLPAGVNAGDVPIWTGGAWSTQDERAGYGPEAWGLLEWNFGLNTGESGAALVSGTRYVTRIVPRVTRTVTNVELYVTGAGATLTAGQNLVAVYNAAGTKLGSDSADQTTPWQSTGRKTAAIGGGAQTFTAGLFYYIEVISVGTTPPSMLRGTNSPLSVNFGQAAASQWFSTNGTGQTTTDASITPGSLAATNLIALWVGLS